MKISAIQNHYAKGQRAASLAIDAAPLDTSITITAYQGMRTRFAFTFYIGRWIKRISL